MEFASSKNKGVVWDVMLEADFFSGLANTDYDTIRKELDAYVESFDVEGTTLTGANKLLIRHMWDFIAGLRETAATPKECTDKALQRSSTI